MVVFFLNATPLSDIDDLEIILGKVAPLVFFEDSDFSTLGHKIYMLVIVDNKNEKTSEYIRQMRNSFDNHLTKESQYIWEDETILKDYVSLLVKGLAYGREEVMEESLEMLEFLMAHTPRVLLEKYILKIVGPIIRISNYPLLMRQKLKIIEFLISIFKSNFKIGAYNNQIMSVCIRLLQEFKNNEDIMHVVANVYYTLIEHTVAKK